VRSKKILSAHLDLPEMREEVSRIWKKDAPSPVAGRKPRSRHGGQRRESHSLQEPKRRLNWLAAKISDIISHRCVPAKSSLVSPVASATLLTRPFPCHGENQKADRSQGHTRAVNSFGDDANKPDEAPAWARRIAKRLSIFLEAGPRRASSRTRPSQWQDGGRH